jgi:hypothetical protein
MRRVAWFWGLWLLTDCTSSSGNAILPESKKEEASGETDDSADKSAPVSGAYLACYVPKPNDTQDQMFGGCQVRDKAGNHVDMRQQAQKFSFVRPGGAKQNLPVAVFDLSKTKTKRMYFDVVYRINLPKAGTGQQGAGVTRAQAGNYFSIAFARNPANQAVVQAVDANANAFLATSVGQSGAEQFVYNSGVTWDSYPLTSNSSGYDDGTYGYVGQGMGVTYDYVDDYSGTAPVYGSSGDSYFDDSSYYGDMSSDTSFSESGTYTYEIEDWSGSYDSSNDSGFNEYDSWSDWDSSNWEAQSTYDDLE